MQSPYTLFSSDIHSYQLGEISGEIEKQSEIEGCKTRLIRVSLAESFFRRGNTRKADALFRGWLNENPDWEWGWIAWADCWCAWDQPCGGRDFDKAERILNEALEMPGLSSKKYVRQRYRKLQRRKREFHLNLY